MDTILSVGRRKLDSVDKLDRTKVILIGQKRFLPISPKYGRTLIFVFISPGDLWGFWETTNTRILPQPINVTIPLQSRSSHPSNNTPLL